MQVTSSLAVAVALVVSAAAVQSPSPFAGKWVYAGDRSPTSQSTRANFGTDFQVTIDGKTLKIERANAGQPVVTTYPLDGKDLEQRSGEIVTVTKARIENNQILMDVSTTTPPDATGTSRVTTSKRRLWLEGDSLISEWIVAPPTNLTIISIYKRPSAAAPPNAPAKTTLSTMSWLVGNWENRLGNTITEERWTSAAGGAMLGVSRTVSAEKMTAFEFLRIIERDGTLVYVAQPNGRAPGTEFTLTRSDPTSAVFENPAHDFPKMITYSLAADGTLTATISDTGGLRAQAFTFRRIQ